MGVPEINFGTLLAVRAFLWEHLMRVTIGFLFSQSSNAWHQDFLRFTVIRGPLLEAVCID